VQLDLDSGRFGAEIVCQVPQRARGCQLAGGMTYDTCVARRRPMSRRHTQLEQRLLNAVAPRLPYTQQSAAQRPPPPSACSDVRAAYTCCLCIRGPMSERLRESNRMSRVTQTCPPTEEIRIADDRGQQMRWLLMGLSSDILRSNWRWLSLQEGTKYAKSHRRKDFAFPCNARHKSPIFMARLGVEDRHRKLCF
jgi:hypothetical protein